MSIAVKLKQRVGVVLAALALVAMSQARAEQPALWQQVASDLPMPYGVLLIDEKLYVSTVPDIVEVGEETGTHHPVKTLAEASPSGLLLDKDRTIVAVENGTGSLIRFNQNFEQLEVLAEGLGDPVTVKRLGNFYYVTDYNFGKGDGRLLRVTPGGATKVYAKLSGPGGFTIDKDEIFVAEFDKGQLVSLQKKGKVRQVVASGLGKPLDIVRLDSGGFIVSDFGGFDGATGRLLHVGENGRVTVLDSSTLGNPAGLLIHGGSLYVTDLIGGRLFKANLYKLLAETNW
ncbi:SMP-30/gluconolactonase/LRE family protein [Allohahella sp. A8]|uniref:SMP-30/gluconolactonase/LRE family protein n=1 Tax=Allohahella sp. A8 TaxID=3141461 RepID=UPI003A80B627